MITEPEYWKKDILSCAVGLRDKIEQTRWPSVSVGHLERTVMSTCYGARKLYESRYIDDEKFHQLIPIYVHDALSREVTADNWSALDIFYDFANSRREERKFSFICNQGRSSVYGLTS